MKFISGAICFDKNPWNDYDDGNDNDDTRKIAQTFRKICIIIASETESIHHSVHIHTICWTKTWNKTNEFLQQQRRQPKKCRIIRETVVSRCVNGRLIRGWYGITVNIIYIHEYTCKYIYRSYVIFENSPFVIRHACATAADGNDAAAESRSRKSQRENGSKMKSALTVRCAGLHRRPYMNFYWIDKSKCAHVGPYEWYKERKITLESHKCTRRHCHHRIYENLYSRLIVCNAHTSSRI